MKNGHNVCGKKVFKGLKKGRSTGNDSQKKRIREVIPTNFFLLIFGMGVGV